MQNYGAYLLSWWGVFWSPLQDYGRNSMLQSIPWMHRLPLQLVPKHRDASFHECRMMCDTESREALSHHLQPLSGRLLNFWIHTTDTVRVYKLGKKLNKEGFPHVSTEAFITMTVEMSAWFIFFHLSLWKIEWKMYLIQKKRMPMCFTGILHWAETRSLWWSDTGFHSLVQSGPGLVCMNMLHVQMPGASTRTAFVRISAQTTLYIHIWHSHILGFSLTFIPFPSLIHHSLLHTGKPAQKQLIILSEAACWLSITVLQAQKLTRPVHRHQRKQEPMYPGSVLRGVGSTQGYHASPFLQQ